ncbi:MAG: hypothetical protein A2046_14465 [Bacteroidetes bacterium GWA2_30_7]|nr:MAG: hypothetical protein A2046_14465 [Bacteroidetes bacterium GWA2_30_7]
MKLLKFINIPFKEKLMLTEAFLLFIVSNMLVTLFPLKFYSKFIGNYMEETNFADNDNNCSDMIFLAIRRAKKALPFKPKCLVNSIVTKKMLDRRNIKNMLYLGLNKNISNNLIAHAWVRVFGNNENLLQQEQQTLTPSPSGEGRGEANNNQFKVIAFFS